MSQSHGGKGGATDEAFEEQGFLWVQTLTFLTFKRFNVHKNLITLWGKGKKTKQHNRG